MIREEFLEYVLWETGTSGQAIADNTKFTLENLTLDLNVLRGQGYDGAGNISGKYRGAAAIVQHDYPKALYVHCVSHVLNLCVVAACSIQANSEHIWSCGGNLPLLQLLPKMATRAKRAC